MDWVNQSVVQTVVKVVNMIISTIVSMITAVVDQVVTSLVSLVELLGADTTTFNIAFLRSVVKMALLTVTTGVAAVLTGSNKLFRLFEALTVVLIISIVFVSFSVGTWLQGLIFGSVLLLLVYGTLVAASTALGQDSEDPDNLAKIFHNNASDLVRSGSEVLKDLGSGALGLPDWPTWVWWAIGGTVGYLIFIKD